MKNLVIAGAGGFGREVYIWARQAREYGVEWRIKGFINDIPDALAKYNYEHEIFASIEEYQPQADDLFVCALGDPAGKKKVCQKLLARGAVFTNLIHPSVTFGYNVNIGKGVIICPGASFSVDISVGDFVTVNARATIGHDVSIKAWTVVGPNCALNGYVRLEEDVSLGANAVILPHAFIGANAVVGAGSVVLKKVKAGQTVFGVPAVPI